MALVPRSLRSGQPSGERTFVRASKWSSRLGIVGLQELAEALARAAELDMHGWSGGTRDPGDLLRRIPGGVVQHDGHSLFLGELAERRHQVPRQIVHLVRALRPFGADVPPRLQLPSGDPEDRPPEPALGVSGGRLPAGAPANANTACHIRPRWDRYRRSNSPRGLVSTRTSGPLFT